MRNNTQAKERSEGPTEDFFNNISYIFIPFHYLENENSDSLPSVLEQSGNWIKSNDKMQYMLKYVTDKIEGQESGKRRCLHYTLGNRAIESYGISGNKFCTEKHSYHGKETEFAFRILSVHLYCFSTSVSILAFQLSFECEITQEPSGESGKRHRLTQEQMLRLSAAQYYLKKVSRERIHCIGDNSIGETTLLQIAEEIMEQSDSGGTFDFFFYAGEDTERANLLTYIEAELRDGYDYELFYLRRCYGENYLYFEDEKQREREIFNAAQDITWGISPEAAVCIVCPERGGEEFIRTKFFGNFNEQYLFMYILLLHQKYVLYLFLTMIDAEMYEDLEKLEEYRKELYKFETDFVYSRVTEVPQYQNLYDRMAEVFSLKDMYEDVREPLLSLSEVRRAELEKQQKSRENKMNQALFLLSLMGAFSAVVDSSQIIEKFFGQFWSSAVVEAAQKGCAVAILLVLIYVVAVLFGFRKK